MIFIHAILTYPDPYTVKRSIDIPDTALFYGALYVIESQNFVNCVGFFFVITDLYKVWSVSITHLYTYSTMCKHKEFFKQSSEMQCTIRFN